MKVDSHTRLEHSKWKVKFGAIGHLGEEHRAMWAADKGNLHN